MQALKSSISKATQKGENFKEKYFSICYELVDFYDKYPLYFKAILQEIIVDIDDLDKDDISVKIYQKGEEINELIKGCIDEAIANKEISSPHSSMQITFTLWASLSGIIQLANNKKDYIKKVMNIEKKQFLQNSFEILISSISS